MSYYEIKNSGGKEYDFENFQKRLMYTVLSCTGGLERTGKERTGKRWKEPENFLLVDDIGKKTEKFLVRNK